MQFSILKPTTEIFSAVPQLKEGRKSPATPQHTVRTCPPQKTLQRFILKKEKKIPEREFKHS